MAEKPAALDAAQPTPFRDRLRDVLILALIAVVSYLLGRGGPADRPAPLLAEGASENRDMIAVTGQFGTGTSVLYLVDTRERTLAVYEARGGSQSDLRLVAARDITYDFRLRRYNDNSEPAMSVDELERKWRSFAKQGGQRKPEEQGKREQTQPKTEQGKKKP